MSWRDLLQSREPDTTVLPWLGGRTLRSGPRSWSIEGELPAEHGWAKFALGGRKACFLSVSEPEPGKLRHMGSGYLVGDRFVSLGSAVDPDPGKIARQAERVYLIEPGLDRFVLVSVGCSCEGGPLVYIQQEMPLGPEDGCLTAYLDGKDSVASIKGVTPALDAAFRMARWQRVEAERRRAAIEEQRRLEEEARRKEELRQEMMGRLGSGAGRRATAAIDFEAAASAALAVGGAEYLDHRGSARRDEMVVRFRLNSRRFECTCDKNTLRIIDSGICLTASGDDEFEYGTKGDTWFTLESLPSVILEADRDGKLVVYRHAD